MLTALRRAVLRSIEQDEVPDGPPSVEAANPEETKHVPVEEPTKLEETEPDAS